MQSPSSANHGWFHLPCRRTSVKPMMPELPEGCGYHLSLMTMELLWSPFRRQVYPVSWLNCVSVVTVNQQLEPHCHPMSLLDDLIRKLDGGHGFTKIDLADAYNQIMLASKSVRRLALGTHRGVLLQTRLPFGISSAPGNFQEIMDQLTSDLEGVAVYMDDILVSGITASEHIQNLYAFLKCLEEKRLHCRQEKCLFAQPSVEYLGHILSQQELPRVQKVDAVKKMPPPGNVSSLHSFWVQFSFMESSCPAWLQSLNHFIA